MAYLLESAPRAGKLAQGARGEGNRTGSRPPAVCRGWGAEGHRPAALETEASHAAADWVQENFVDWIRPRSESSALNSGE